MRSFWPHSFANLLRSNRALSLPSPACFSKAARIGASVRDPRYFVFSTETSSYTRRTPACAIAICLCYFCAVVVAITRETPHSVRHQGLAVQPRRAETARRDHYLGSVGSCTCGKKSRWSAAPPQFLLLALLPGRSPFPVLLRPIRISIFTLSSLSAMYTVHSNRLTLTHVSSHPE